MTYQGAAWGQEPPDGVRLDELEDRLVDFPLGCDTLSLGVDVVPLAVTNFELLLDHVGNCPRAQRDVDDNDEPCQQRIAVGLVLRVVQIAGRRRVAHGDLVVRVAL